MQTITFRHASHSIPSHIDELSHAQYIAYLRLFLMNLPEDLTRRRLFPILLSLPIADYHDYRQDIIAELDTWQSALDPFFVAGHLTLNTTRQMLREYRGWKGPGDMLDGINFGQFIAALIMYEEFIRLTAHGGSADGIPTAANDCLLELTRQLYTAPTAPTVPGGSAAGSPADSSPADSPRPSDLLILHATHFFVSCYQYIAATPVHINGYDIDLSIIFTASGGSPARHRTPDDHTGWQGIAFEIAEQGLFGTYNDLMRQPLFDVLLYLYKRRFEQLHKKRK